MVFSQLEKRVNVIPYKTLLNTFWKKLWRGCGQYPGHPKEVICGVHGTANNSSFRAL